MADKPEKPKTVAAATKELVAVQRKWLDNQTDPEALRALLDAERALVEAQQAAPAVTKNPNQGVTDGT